MKSKFLPVTWTVLLLFISISMIAQQKRTITLMVDTSSITNQNVNEVSTFGQADEISNVDFTTHVNLGDTIVWRGISSYSEADIVEITQINHEGGTRVFSKNVLNEDRNNPGTVMGIVTEGRDGDEEKYKISFRVINDSDRSRGVYHIDPKIQVKNSLAE